MEEPDILSSVSLIVITLNEEDSIARCLDSAGGWLGSGAQWYIAGSMYPPPIRRIGPCRMRVANGY